MKIQRQQMHWHRNEKEWLYKKETVENAVSRRTRARRVQCPCRQHHCIYMYLVALYAFMFSINWYYVDIKAQIEIHWHQLGQELNGSSGAQMYWVYFYFVHTYKGYLTISYVLVFLIVLTIFFLTWKILLKSPTYF